MKNILLFLQITTFLLFTNSGLYLKSQGWEKLEELQNPINLPVMASANGKIYLLSGTSGPNGRTLEYNPTTNSWSERTPIPQGCYYPTAVEVNGKIYVMGGGQPSYANRKDYNYIYDPVNDSWSEGNPLPDARLYHSAAAVNGKIYLIGGQNGDGTTEWYFDEYDTGTDTWQRKSQILHNQSWYCGAAGIGDNFYRIAGGRWNGPTNYFEEYNTLTDTWTELNPCPVSLHAPAAVNYFDKIILMGGYCNGNPIDSIYIYYPDNDFWSLSFNRLPEPMAYHKATVLDDYVYVYDKDSTGQFGRLWRYKFAYLNTEDEIVFNEPAIKIFPNPSSGSFRIEFREKPVEQMQVMVFNILGKEVISIDRKLKEKEYLDIDMNNQNKGIYFVRIQQGERKYCKPVIIH